MTNLYMMIINGPCSAFILLFVVYWFINVEVAPSPPCLHWLLHIRLSAVLRHMTGWYILQMVVVAVVVVDSSFDSTLVGVFPIRKCMW